MKLTLTKQHVGGRLPRRWVAFPASMALVLVAASAAHADTAGLSPADKETSRALYAEGMKALDARDFAGAERACGGARALARVPTADACWGRALEGLGHLLEARDAFLEAARYPVKPEEPAVFAAARESSDEEAEQLSKRIPTVTLVVSGPNESAPLSVKVDGATVAPKTARLPRKVNPGKHTVDVSAVGFLPMTVDVDVGEGEDRHVGVALAPSNAQADKSISAIPRAPVSTETQEARGPGLPAWIAFGTGAAGLIVGAVAGTASLVSASNAKSHCSGTVCTPHAQGPIADAKTWAAASDVGFVVAGLGAAVGGGLLLWGRPESAPTATASAKVVIGLGSIDVRGIW